MVYFNVCGTERALLSDTAGKIGQVYIWRYPIHTDSLCWILMLACHDKLIIHIYIYIYICLPHYWHFLWGSTVHQCICISNGGVPKQKVSNAELWSFIQPEQLVKNVDVSGFGDALRLIWRMKRRTGNNGIVFDLHVYTYIDTHMSRHACICIPPPPPPPQKKKEKNCFVDPTGGASFGNHYIQEHFLQRKLWYLIQIFWP